MTDVETGLRMRQQARDLFMQYGLRSVSMDDIANRLGVSKKTIYQYYADKDELIVAVIENELQCTKFICERDKVEAVNAVQETFLSMDMVIELFNTMNPSMLFDMEKYHPKAFQKFLRHKNDYIYNLIRENIIRGIKEELYRPDVRIDVLTRFRVETMMLVFHPDFHAKLNYSLAQLEEEFITHFLYGLSTPKGYKLISKYQQERKNITNDAKK